MCNYIYAYWNLNILLRLNTLLHVPLHEVNRLDNSREIILENVYAQ